MNKPLIANEHIKQRLIDSISIGRMRGEAYIKNTVTGETVFSKNKVIIEGSLFTACKLFGIEPTISLPSYNNELLLDNTVNIEHSTAEEVCLFAIGTGGCGQESSQKLPVDYSKWIDPGNLIPFRHVIPTKDLNPEQRTKYFGRRTLTDYISYYFKTFDQLPKLILTYKDGTPVTEEVYNSSNNMDIDCYIQLRFSVTKEEAREIFKASGNLDQASISAISLLHAWAYTNPSDGYVYYQDIKPLTVLNLNKEDMSDETKGLDITYNVYF